MGIISTKDVRVGDTIRGVEWPEHVVMDVVASTDLVAPGLGERLLGFVFSVVVRDSLTGTVDFTRYTASAEESFTWLSNRLDDIEDNFDGKGW